MTTMMTTIMKREIEDFLAPCLADSLLAKIKSLYFNLSSLAFKHLYHINNVKNLSGSAEKQAIWPDYSYMVGFLVNLNGNQ